MKKFLSFFAAMLVALVANAATINIDNTTPDALRLALNSANNFDEIVMAAGTYVESNSNYIAIDGKEVFIKAAEGAEVIIQPQVPITISNGGVATFENVKIDASRLTELADWYEHLIYAADGAINGLRLKGCELYNFALNKSMIYCSSTNKFAGITIENCYIHDVEKSVLFIENTAKTMSAQIKNSTFENIVAHVTDSYWAGIIDIRATEALITFDHCTFYNVIPMNTDYSAVSKVTLENGTVSNCIFMLPTAQDNIRAMRGVAATNCITYNYLKDSGTGIHSTVTQTNCVQVDPLFVDAANGDYTLGEGSPALTMNDGAPIGDPRWVPADEPEPQPAELDSLVIEFKDSGTSSDSNTGLTSTTIADYVTAGADYLSAIAPSNKVYNGATGYGLKFGNSSNPGSITMTLKTPVKPTSIVMCASQYGATEGSALLQDSTINITAPGQKGNFAEYTYEYDGNTEVTTIVVGTTVKRGYIKYVKVYYPKAEEPQPQPADEYCAKATGHLGQADFADPNARILLTIKKGEGNNVVVSVKNNNEAGNTKTGLNYLWVNAEGATGVARYGDGTHAEADVEEVSVVVEFNEAKENYNFINIHWAYSGWDGEWAIDGLQVAADELCPGTEPIIGGPEYYLVGSMNEWNTTNPAEAFHFEANPGAEGEYMLTANLAANDQFKVVGIVGNTVTWYPDGDNNYIVDAAHAGEAKKVYFRPDGQGGEGWHYGVIFVEENPAPQGGLKAVSDSTTWDFSKLTINTSSANYNEGDNAIKLSGETTPKNTDTLIYAAYAGQEWTIDASFAGESMAFVGQYPARKNQFCQNGTLMFEAAVPGTIVVKFSDTGSSASATAVKRYLIVNGDSTEYWTSRENNGTDNPYPARLNVVTGAIPVPAGLVTIAGSSAITVYQVTFVPTPVEHTYTLAGSSAAIFGTTWDAANTANDMVKQEDGTYKFEKTEVTLAAGKIEFKLVEDHTKWAPDPNMELDIPAPGVYTITITFDPNAASPAEQVKAVATKTADAEVLPMIIMHGNFSGNWADTEEFVVAEDKLTASLTMTLTAGTYEFGMKFDGSWKANGAQLTREAPQTSLLEGNGNMKITADVEGEYVFTYTFLGEQLVVTYPAQSEGIEDIDASAKAVKVLHNGQILILRGDKVYTVTGQPVK